MIVRNALNHANRCVSCTANLPFLRYWRPPWLAIECDHVVRRGQASRRTNAIIVSPTYHTGSCLIDLLLPLAWAYRKETSIYSTRSSMRENVVIECRVLPRTGFVEGYVSLYTRLAETLTALHAWRSQNLPSGGTPAGLRSAIVESRGGFSVKQLRPKHKRGVHHTFTSSVSISLVETSESTKISKLS